MLEYGAHNSGVLEVALNMYVCMTYYVTSRVSTNKII